MPLPKKAKGPTKTSLPSFEEDFEQVPVEDLNEPETSLPSEIEEPISEKYATENDRFIKEDKVKNKKKKEKFIDKKNKKLKPVGRKMKDYDDRQDISTSKRVQRGLVLFALAIVVLLGLKNTFWPNNTYSPAEIENIAKTSVGKTLFPDERGQAFAENFIRHYVNLDKEDTASATQLSYFYTGEISNSGTQSGQVSSDFITVNATDNKQKVIGMPVTFEKTSLSDYSANYKISVLVTDENGQEKAANGVVTSHWLSFSVNVYYNAETNALSIHKGSPVLIPTYEIAPTENNKEEAPIGNGEENTKAAEDLKPTIQGYWKAFSSVSVNKHTAIDQYVAKDADISLYSGFNNTVKLATDDPDADIEYKVYGSQDAENEYKADVTVRWMDNTASNTEKAAVYTSRYIMTIKETGGGKYVVTRAAPYLYV